MMGQPLAEGVADTPPDVLRCVETELTYELPRGIETIKVRMQTDGDTIGDPGIFTMDDFETGPTVPAIATGTLNSNAANARPPPGLRSHKCGEAHRSGLLSAGCNLAQLQIRFPVEDRQWLSACPQMLMANSTNFFQMTGKTGDPRKAKAPTDMSIGAELILKTTILLSPIKDGTVVSRAGFEPAAN